MNYKIIEVYDGRLPEYQITDDNNKIIKSFDSFEEAETYLKSTILKS